MASGFFALLDDVAAMMDDVASMTKVATQKTAGILGDDLAVNAEKAMGFSSSRELPVLWRIAKGSLLNKAIILPLAFVLDAWLPWFIEWVLVAGGAFLAFEGAEKVSHTWHAFRSKSKEHKIDKRSAIPDEAQRVRSAILVDFILSVEIVILAMSSVQDTGWESRLAVVSLVALLATVGVYGLGRFDCSHGRHGALVDSKGTRPWESHRSRAGAVFALGGQGHWWLWDRRFVRGVRGHFSPSSALVPSVDALVGPAHHVPGSGAGASRRSGNVVVAPRCPGGLVLGQETQRLTRIWRGRRASATLPSPWTQPQ